MRNRALEMPFFHFFVGLEESHGTAEIGVVFHEAIDLHQTADALLSLLKELLVGLHIAVDDGIVDMEDRYTLLFKAVAEEGVLVAVLAETRVKAYLLEDASPDDEVVGHERLVWIPGADTSRLALDTGAIEVAQAMLTVVATLVVDATTYDNIE
jgi:hypothetical protein